MSDIPVHTAGKLKRFFPLASAGDTTSPFSRQQAPPGIGKRSEPKRALGVKPRGGANLARLPKRTAVRDACTYMQRAKRKSALLTPRA